MTRYAALGKVVASPLITSLTLFLSFAAVFFLLFYYSYTIFCIAIKTLGS